LNQHGAEREKMLIKYAEEELFDFFEGNPISIGELEAGDWLYTYEQGAFKIVLLILTYEMGVEITICYNENIIYSQKHDHISEIRKIDSNTMKILKEEEQIIIKKAPQIGAIIEPMME
jgi:phage-related protein